MLFCSCDLDLEPMTLTYKCDPDILKMYLHPKMKFLGRGFQALQHKQHRHTDRHDQKHYNTTFVGGNKQG